MIPPSEGGWAGTRHGDPLTKLSQLCSDTSSCQVPPKHPVLTQNQVLFHTSPFTMGSQPLPSVCDIPEALIQACCPQHIHKLFKRRLPPLGTAVRAVFLACSVMCARFFTRSLLSPCAGGFNTDTTGNSAPGLCKPTATLPLESCPRGGGNFPFICSQILTSQV